MSEELKDFYELLIIKNHLIKVPIEDLKKTYKSNEDFLWFLDAVALLTQKEKGFLLLSDEIKKRIITVIEDHKFDCDSETLEVINDTVVYFNQLENVNKLLKEIIRKSYIAYQEKIRGVNFLSEESLFESLSYDGIVFNALKDNDLSAIDDSDYFLLSISYLISSIPEFFQNDEVHSNTKQLIEEERKKSKVLSSRKRITKRMLKDLVEINKKEE